MRYLRPDSTRAQVAVILLLLGSVVLSLHLAWDSWAASQGLPEPSNIAAIRRAERGALGKPAFVDFYSDDCSICRRIQGPIAELDQRFGYQTKFIYIDTDLPAAQSLMNKYKVRGLPTFVLLDEHGRKVSEISGWPGEQALEIALNATTRRE